MQNQKIPVCLFVECTEENKVLKSGATEHETEMELVRFYLGEEKPGSQREVALEEDWLHGMEEDHHELHQLEGDKDYH